jgi:hypothetical protein
VQVTYPVHTLIQAEAIKIAVNLAKASGYKTANVVKVVQIGASAWNVTLVVM